MLPGYNSVSHAGYDNVILKFEECRLADGQVLGEVPAGSTCTFDRGGGDAIWLANPSASAPADVLLLTGEPLREPVAMGGPIVTNTAAEIQQAYAELRAGTFL